MFWRRLKYAIGPYEDLAQFASLTKKACQDYSLDEFRDLLGVPPGRYKAFGELNRHVLKQAVTEVNALAPFGVSVMPIRQGKRVVQIRVGWWSKEGKALRDALDELQRSKVGRRARITGTAEHVSAPLPSITRMMRAARLDRRGSSPKTS
jgi:plasmid replication initiation protein